MKRLTDWMDRTSRTSFLLMLVVGVYLLYAIYKMYQGLGSSGNPLPIYVFMVLFAVIGVLLLIMGVFAFVSGHYRERAGTSEDDTSEDDAS